MIINRIYKNSNPFPRQLIFSSRDMAEARSLQKQSARLACHRYSKRGVFIRLKRDVYVLWDRWQRATFLEMCAAANRMQVPSYISLTTALAFHEVTTQVQQDFFESVAVIRTKTLRAGGSEFRYVKVQKRLYFGFVKEKEIFIATPEKALLDALYLVSLHRYRLDLSALDISKLNRRKTERMAKFFPKKTRLLLRTLWKN